MNVTKKSRAKHKRHINKATSTKQKTTIASTRNRKITIQKPPGASGGPGVGPRARRAGGAGLVSSFANAQGEPLV